MNIRVLGLNAIFSYLYPYGAFSIAYQGFLESLNEAVTAVDRFKHIL